jgi:serine/threonine-protein kinase RsbW
MVATAHQTKPRYKVEAYDDDPWSRFTLSSLSEIRSHVKAILIAMSRREFTVSDGFAVQLAVAEALTNAIRHGNREQPGKFVHLRYLVLTDQVWVEVEDEGRGFAPDAVPDPTQPENLGRPSGRGVFLMRSYMTHVEFSKGGRQVRLQRRRGFADHGVAS